VVKESCSTWRLVRNETLQGSIIGPVLSTTFINGLKQMAECTLIRCEVTPNRKDQLMHLRARLPAEGTQDRLEQQANGNVTKFNKDKCKDLLLGMKSFLQQYRLWAARLGISSAP